MNTNGWILVHRCITDHWIWLNDKQSYRWIDMIMMAAWKKEFIFIRSNPINMERGQIVTTIRALSRRWKTNIRVVSSFINILEQSGMITCDRSSHLWILITIVNYDKYQNLASLAQRGNNDIQEIMGVYIDPEDDVVDENEQNGSHNGNQSRNHKEARITKEINKKNNNNLSNNTREEEVFGVVESKMNSTLSDYCEELKHSDASIEQAMLALRRDKKCVLELIDIFVPEMQFQNKVHADFNDFKKHFINWAKIQLQNEKRNGKGGQKQQGNNPDDQLKRRRGTDVGHHKASDYGGPFSIQPDSPEGL